MKVYLTVLLAAKLFGMAVKSGKNIEDKDWPGVFAAVTVIALYITGICFVWSLKE